MTSERLPAVQTEVVVHSKDHDLVVHGLTRQPLAWGEGNRATVWIETVAAKSLTIGVECHSRHGVHAGLCNVLHVHGDVPACVQKTELKSLLANLKGGQPKSSPSIPQPETLNLPTLTRKNH